MDNESGEFVGGDEETGERRSESEVERDWYEVVGEKREVYSRDKQKHVEKNDRLFVKMTTKLDDREGDYR